MFFNVLKNCKNTQARISAVKLQRKMITLPIFMPVATHGVLKSSHYKVSGIVLGNTFHLRQLNADLKDHMGIDACLTDSGGFQIISLKNSVNEDGIFFTDYDRFGNFKNDGKYSETRNYQDLKEQIRAENFTYEEIDSELDSITEQESHIEFAFCKNVYCFSEDCTGCQEKEEQKNEYLQKYKNFKSESDTYLLTPEKSIYIQNTLNSDIAMQLDDVIRPESNKKRHLIAVKRSIRWLDRLLQVNRNEEQRVFPIIQGGLHEDLRKFSVDEILKRTNHKAIKGIAIGGLCGGENKKSFCEIIYKTSQYVKSRYKCPIYVMGVGYPEDVLISICLGSDMSDCVYPTRIARFGKIFTDYGDINVSRLNNFKGNENLMKRNNLHFNNCDCRTCKQFSLEFLHQLKETPNFCILLTEHNLFYMENLTNRIKKAIEDENLNSFLVDWVNKRYNKCLPEWIEYALDLINSDKK